MKPDFGHFALTTFDLQWEIETTIEPERHHGTGFLLDDILVAVFRERHESWYGAVSYRIVSREVLRGVWLGYNGDVVGEEELRRNLLADRRLPTD